MSAVNGMIIERIEASPRITNEDAAPASFNLLITLAVFAVLLRVAIFFSASHYGHITLAAYTSKADTTSYIAYAAAISGERTFSSLEEYDRRVFPGYPALIAVVHQLHIPLAICALLVTWISAGVSVFAAGRLFADRRVAYAMVCLVPHYLINSSLGMSEAPLLAIVLIGLLIARQGRAIPAGLMLGFAGLIRPMACFAVAGAIYNSVRKKRWKPVVLLAGTAGLTTAIGVLLLQLWTGDALQGERVYANHPGAYAGHMILFPFQSLLTTPFHEPTSIGRIVYTWIHVVITLAACVLITRRAATAISSDPRDAISWPWLAGNTLFVLCIGSAWGFRHFPRFTIPAAPAMFWTLRKYLPIKAGIWIAIIAMVFVFAVKGVMESP